MTFQPVIPSAGLAGWRFLERTFDSQNEAFQKSPSVTRDVDFFLENVGSISSAEDLVSDRRMLRVALGAYGLQDDINNRFFIRTVLEEGTTSSDALANRLADDRYKAFSKAFGFGEATPPKTGLSTFAAEVADRFRRQEFELAVGQIDDTMRLALNAEREFGPLATENVGEDTKWFRIMGTPPLREVMEGALGLPQSIGQLDIDRQLDEFKNRARSVFGDDSISQFSEDEKIGRLIDQYLVRAQIDQGTSLSSGSIAISLLQPLTQRA